MSRPKAIVPLKAETQESGINLLIYGEPGVGKSVLAGSAPKTLIIAAPTENPASAAMRGSTADIWRVSDWDTMQQIEEYMRHEGCDDYNWLWLDTVTLMQEFGLDDIMENLHAEKPHRMVYLPDKGEYGQNMTRLGQWVRHMRGLPINFGITAHQLRTEDDEGRVTYMPYIQGKGMPEKISGYMGAVGRLQARKLEDGKIERKLITTKQTKWYAKDNFNGALGGTMLDPTIPKIEAAIKAKIESAPTKATKRPARKAAQKRSN